MADTAEDLALRLQQFVDAADQAAQSSFPSQVRVQPVSPRTPRKPRIQQVYVNCVGRLTDDERCHLRRMIEKMAGGLGIP
jgi:hypothetical protein